MIFFLYIWLHNMCMSSVHGGQKKVSDILKMELQIVVSCHVAAGNRTWETQVLRLNSFTSCVEFIYIPYILKLILRNIFHYFIHETKFHGMESSIYGLLLVLRICPGFGFGIRTIQLTQARVWQPLPSPKFSRCCYLEFQYWQYWKARSQSIRREIQHTKLSTDFSSLGQWLFFSPGSICIFPFGGFSSSLWAQRLAWTQVSCLLAVW